MDSRIFTEPQQGASYATLLAVAKATEDLGFDAFFRSDHYLSMGDGDGLPGPTYAWITLAGLARETRRIRLGTLVTPVTFRYPGPLAISVAQVDAMSDGRVELGLGAGWFEAEHTAYGIPYPANRFDHLEEQLAIITGLWSTPAGERFEYTGKHYEIVDSPALPKPVQQPVPIIMGGGGAKRTPALAARYAAEFNTPFRVFDESVRLFAGVRDACQEIGRDPGTMTFSASLQTAIGKDEAQFRRRAAAARLDADQVRADGLGGTPDEIVDKLGRYREAGTQRVYFQILDLDDLDHLELIASDVMRQL
jgi:F420-dependent oxidoreductase-like protein